MCRSQVWSISGAESTDSASVSLSADARCPPVSDRSPACGAAFSLIDLHGACQEQWTSVHYGCEHKAGTKSFTEAPEGFRPTLDQLIREARFFFPIVDAPGAERRGVEVAGLTVNVYIR